MEHARRASIWNLNLSTQKHFTGLGIGNRSVRCALNEDLDGTTAHAAGGASIYVLHPLFRDHFISRFADILGPRSPLICPCVVISCWKTSRHICPHISPIHIIIWRKLFTWKSPKLTIPGRVKANLQDHLQKCVPRQRAPCGGRWYPHLILTKANSRQKHRSR